jgi:hypothetical protein
MTTDILGDRHRRTTAIYHEKLSILQLNTNLSTRADFSKSMTLSGTRICALETLSKSSWTMTGVRGQQMSQG